MLSEKYPYSGWSSVRVYRYRELLEHDAVEPPAPPKPDQELVTSGGKGPMAEVSAKSSHLDSLSDYQRNRLKTKLELRYEKYGQETLLVYYVNIHIAPFSPFSSSPFSLTSRPIL